MNNLLRHYITGIAVALLLLAAASPAAAGNQWINVEITAQHISWSPTVTHQGAKLRISHPDGDVVEHLFTSTAAFSLSADTLTNEGSYTWELTLTPKLGEDARARLERARTTGDATITDQLRSEGTLPPAEALIHAGHFRVKGGSFVTAVDAEEPATRFLEKGSVTVDRDGGSRDQVILDDLIVDGSACIGFDCNNGESFGFDTIRLKENNLRIRAQDTSATASFPSRDWQLTFNDSSNGGANKFSIDDIDGGRTPFTIEAGARSHSLYVDDAGRIGIGTSTPVVNLHIKTGNSPTVRLEQDGSAGFTPQTWDLAGNEANFFIRDATNGSTLPFRIVPGAPSNAVFIANTGNVGIGTSSPSGDLHLRDTSATDDSQLWMEANGQQWLTQVLSSDGDFNITNVSTGTTALTIEPAATSGSIFIGSGGRVGINTITPQRDAALDVNGEIFQRGSQLHADYVFNADHELESIEDHASFMWHNKHLPAVPGRTITADGMETVGIGAHRRGILEELEKAHIYIEQLNERINALEAALLANEVATEK